MISATDINSDDWKLKFTVINVSCGYFENVNNPGVPITTFIQQQIIDGEIQFVRTGGKDGEECFEITVDDGEFKSKPKSGLVNLFVTEEDYTMWYAIAAGVAGVGILSMLGLYAYKKHWFSYLAKYKRNSNKMKRQRTVDKGRELQEISSGKEKWIYEKDKKAKEGYRLQVVV